MMDGNNKRMGEFCYIETVSNNEMI